MTLHLCLLTLALTSCMSSDTSGQSTGAPAASHPAAASPNWVAATGKAIWTIFQDSKGNNWFGSDGYGVYRYDGKIILHFGTKQGLAGDRVREVKEDNAGNIYINTLGGISKWDGRSLTTLAPDSSTDAVWRLDPDDLWFTTPQELGGVYRYDGKTLYHLKFPASPLEAGFRRSSPLVPFSLYGVYSIVKDSRGAIWFGTSTFGACRYDGTAHAWLYEPELSLIPGGGSIGIRGILEESPGRFWISNDRQRFVVAATDSVANGFHYIRYTKEAGTSDVRSTGATYYQTVLKDKAGDIWMQTYSAGVFRYNRKTMAHYPVRSGAATVPVVTMYQDRRGVIWLGTAGDGVYNFNGKRFVHF